jgi:lipoyl-dependent peroxiredoxin
MGKLSVAKAPTSVLGTDGQTEIALNAPVPGVVVGRHGSIRSDHGLLDLELALPKTLGGKGDATNPEQLFAGGYAACFENALFHVSREARRHFADDDIEVVAQIGLSRTDSGGLELSAALAVNIAGVDQKTAGQLVEGAHAICPYSNAIKGNVDVQIAVAVR